MRLKRIRNGAFVLGLLATLAVACGGSQTAEPTTPAGDGAAAGSDAPPADKAFDDMAAGEKLKYMKEVVSPQMAKTFQGFDAEHYAEFNCVTCHGPGAKDGNFEMPTASLPKLPENMDALLEEKPDVMKFMSETVKPQMAELLGESDFGCFDCHQKE